MEENGGVNVTIPTTFPPGYVTWAWVYRGICALLITVVIWFANDKYNTDRQSRMDAYAAIDKRLERIETVLFIPAFNRTQAAR